MRSLHSSGNEINAAVSTLGINSLVQCQTLGNSYSQTQKLEMSKRAKCTEILIWVLINNNIIIIIMSSLPSHYSSNCKAVCLLLAFLFVGASAWPEHWYKFMHISSGKCVEVSSFVGKKVFIASCREVNNQLWAHFGDHKYKDMESKYCFKITNTNRLILDVCNEKSLIIKMRTYGPSKGYQLYFDNTNLCMEVFENGIANGTSVQAATCHRSINPRFKAQEFRMLGAHSIDK